eukprot:TRINITY_DN68187_c0_g1_i1.p1 TRINITY_DN68187_c0_g1~~TRINITY_DN68187_c0_g1_i1.p1  ORF type:complete len:603 (-),score=111.99 TRINITY_DN68187_c0_g1_i1:589-2343(-)
MEGWVNKRFPSVKGAWRKRWCVFQEGAIITYTNETCQVTKGFTVIAPTMRIFAFHAIDLPDEVVAIRNERPYGFVVDRNPDGGKDRRLLLFEVSTELISQKWVRAIKSGVFKKGAATVPRPLRPPKPQRHLVLHMDVNKTIVLTDSVKGQLREEYVLSILLAECAWGFGNRLDPSVFDSGDMSGPLWKLVSPNPEESLAELRPDGAKTYFELLKDLLPGKDGKKKREAIASVFTEETSPGHPLRSVFHEITKVARQGIRQGGHGMCILPAFYRSLLLLQEQKRSFSVVFRSFGKDLPVLVQEFNAFCEGKHNIFPGARFDGTTDAPDLRVTHDCLGSWVRSDNDFYGMVWGALEIEEDLVAGLKEAKGGPPEEAVRNVVAKLNAQREAKNASDMFRETVGLTAVSAELQARTAKPCCLALRDYFPYWSANNQVGIFGKPLVVDLYDESRLDIFFDDNIIPAGLDSGIIDVRYGSKALQAPYSRQYYLVRAEALSALQDQHWFYNKIMEKEKCSEKRMKARVMFQQQCLKVSRARTQRLLQSYIKPDSQELKPWKTIDDDMRKMSLRKPQARAFEDKDLHVVAMR